MLDRAALANPNPGSPGLQRLNRAEYKNAIRDLLALDIDVTAMLPPDTASFGFDNNADALTLSPALTERYLSAAAKISQVALTRPRGIPTPETFFEPTDRNVGRRVSDEMPFGTRGGIALHYLFPADGDYLIETRPKENGANDGFENFSTEVHQLDIAIDSVKVWSAGLGGPGVDGHQSARSAAGRARKEDARPDEGHRAREGRSASRSGVLRSGKPRRSPRTSSTLRCDGSRIARSVVMPKLSYLRITGPLTGTAATGDTESRRRVLICSPSSATDETCAKRIISTLARRAYRRPVTDTEIAVPLARYRDGAKQGGFESGVEMALRSILVSPNFLFRVESQPPGIAPNMAYRLSDIDLASRLSFFIWSSIPDETLLDLAAKGALHRPEVIQQQVRRMLADQKSQALVDNFAGQWLHVRNVQTHQPSPETLFHFDDNLREALEKEMNLFFGSIVRENRANHRLARRQLHVPERAPREALWDTAVCRASASGAWPCQTTASAAGCSAKARS